MEMLQMVAVVLALLFFGCGGEAPTRPEEVQEKIYSAGELRYLVEQKPDDAKKLELRAAAHQSPPRAQVMQVGVAGSRPRRLSPIASPQVTQSPYSPSSMRRTAA